MTTAEEEAGRKSYNNTTFTFTISTGTSDLLHYFG